jgi:hypothetical protein
VCGAGSQPARDSQSRYCLCRCRLTLLVAIAATAAAQTVTVYSEFTRVDPFGQFVQADRGANEPREILSPAIARNALASFHVVVEGQPGQQYRFQMAQNPDDAVRLAAWRERYTQAGDAWIPDALEQVRLPYDATLGDEPALATQTAQAFWVDMIADRNAPVRRIRVEAQVLIGDGWVLYPMEVRVRPPVLGSRPLPHGAGAGDISLPLSASALVPWSRALCTAANRTVPPAASASIRNFIARNAEQDIRFAGGVPPPALLRLAGVVDRAAFCRTANLARPGEDYLLIRDALVRARE